MNDRSRNDEQGADHGSVDPYRYLTSGSGEDASYLPSEVVQERAAQSSATPGASSPATGGPHGGEDEEADDVTVGMTRRELRELRARRAARAAANPAGGAAADGAAAEPSAAADETAVVALPPGTDDEATTTLAAVTDGDATPAPARPAHLVPPPGAPRRSRSRARASVRERSAGTTARVMRRRSPRAGTTRPRAAAARCPGSSAASCS